ncbi:hypothetical protein PFUGPA_06015 [Plasmodium falciparum Palo Alto/Uganda]|uniref:AAA family ATPase, CDC48 subfamily n=3 Tax=Plasmodium falciparum TaxID=5833 RepID=A0A024WA48_PLAFA|nr:hypothetical protein PFTANZ_01783 [Plasmodium falciparum Tanzania (2000708)]ETW51977.1 hypothetical protein PFUGPA_06015 [Plasmodium falciparum Palo Alto/Uganda]ETW62518.1 hypothetical protein PFMC_01710 [Plasmodium falciparum CAMP/Malaysia]
MKVRKMHYPLFSFTEYLSCYIILYFFVFLPNYSYAININNYHNKNNLWNINNKWNNQQSNHFSNNRIGHFLWGSKIRKNPLASISTSITTKKLENQKKKTNKNESYSNVNDKYEHNNNTAHFVQINYKNDQSNDTLSTYKNNNEMTVEGKPNNLASGEGKKEIHNTTQKILEKVDYFKEREKITNSYNNNNNNNKVIVTHDNKNHTNYINKVENKQSDDKIKNLNNKYIKKFKSHILQNDILGTISTMFWSGKKNNNGNVKKGIKNVPMDEKSYSPNDHDNNSNNSNNNNNNNNDNNNSNNNNNNNNGGKNNSYYNEKTQKGVNDKETNFLLKALDSGKFPTYCLVENIDENLDNFDIYMSKEKMDELNINDGATVLLKGKKKREMLGIARLDRSLKKHYVVISFAMKKNLRLMHNDIIKIHPFMNAKRIRNVVLSPFSDTIPNLSREELEKAVIHPYLKNSYKPLRVNSNIYIYYKNNKIEFKVLKIISEESENEEFGCIGEHSQLTLAEEYLKREDYEENNDDITYEDLGGMKKQLNKIRELIELPLKYPEIFMSIGISAPKGVLMHGIPGTGKTSIAKAIANESNAYCYIINGPEIMSKHIGESEQKLRKIFKKASEKTPCIIFIDEIDSIANKRSKSNNELEKRVVSQLLTLMDGLKKNNNVLVLAATNRPNSIDPALRRFGRFDREIEIPVPDEQGRYEILLTKTKKMKLDPDVNLRKIAKECHGYVGADLAQLCFEAAIQCIKEHIHFLDLDEEDFIEFMKISVDEDKKNMGNEPYGSSHTNNSNYINHLTESSNKLSYTNMFPLNRKNTLLQNDKNEMNKDSSYDKKTNALDNYKNDSTIDMEKKKNKKKSNFFFSNDDEETKNKNKTNVNQKKKKNPNDKLDKNERRIPAYILNKLTIKAKHFQHALNICNPSSLRERQVQIPTVTWNDIGGMNEVKEQLKETILYPLEYKHLYNKFNSNYNKGILLYGPPGCGKTLLAKAIANECKANFISVKGPELLTMWFGESEANVRDLFDKARAASPCIIFFDEIDSLAKERNSNTNNDASDRVINQILTEIDGINEKKTIFIIAATNRPDILDKALTRPGRLDKLIYISLPDLKSRYSIFKAILKNTPLNEDVDIHDMAKRTEGFSGADITNLCQSAVNEAIKETIHLLNIRKKEQEEQRKKNKNSFKIDDTDTYDPVPTLSKKHFDLAFKNARISIQPEDVLKYEKFKEKLSLQDF